MTELFASLKLRLERRKLGERRIRIGLTHARSPSDRATRAASPRSRSLKSRRRLRGGARDPGGPGRDARRRGVRAACGRPSRSFGPIATFGTHAAFGTRTASMPRAVLARWPWRGVGSRSRRDRLGWCGRRLRHPVPRSAARPAVAARSARGVRPAASAARRTALLGRTPRTPYLDHLGLGGLSPQAWLRSSRHPPGPASAVTSGATGRDAFGGRRFRCGLDGDRFRRSRGGFGGRRGGSRPALRPASSFRVLVAARR